MIKTLLLTTMLSISVFGMEIIIDKTVRKLNLSTLERDDAKEVVVDSATGIMWQDNSAAASVRKNWQDAKEYCSNLNFAGYNDWRLPTISELETLIDTTKYNPAVKGGFHYVTSSHYWSSSPLVYGSENAWHVYFKRGLSSYYYKADEFYVRCARAGQ